MTLTSRLSNAKLSITMFFTSETLWFNETATAGHGEMHMGYIPVIPNDSNSLIPLDTCLADIKNIHNNKFF